MEITHLDPEASIFSSIENKINQTYRHYEEFGHNKLNLIKVISYNKL